ncbi:MAG: hypothetical protein M3R06_02505 [Chloroflexota bacterium]|nr:hypothetical protein [Chloroflexota bacterium]
MVEVIAYPRAHLEIGLSLPRVDTDEPPPGMIGERKEAAIADLPAGVK